MLLETLVVIGMAAAGAVAVLTSDEGEEEKTCPRTGSKCTGENKKNYCKCK